MYGDLGDYGHYLLRLKMASSPTPPLNFDPEKFRLEKVKPLLLKWHHNSIDPASRTETETLMDELDAEFKRVGFVTERMQTRREWEARQLQIEKEREQSKEAEKVSYS
jgi:hypothetical protein